MDNESEDRKHAQASDQETASRQGDGTGEIRRRPVDQGGHAGTGAHGGQQSGGMGGMHGGDLHDVGSGQSGMTGRGGMGGNTEENRQGGDEAILPPDAGNRQSADVEAAYDEVAEVQQSAQREGMGHHRHSGRGHEQAIDADADVDDLGSHHDGAGRSGA